MLAEYLLIRHDNFCRDQWLPLSLASVHLSEILISLLTVFCVEIHVMLWSCRACADDESLRRSPVLRVRRKRRKFARSVAPQQQRYGSVSS